MKVRWLILLAIVALACCPKSLSQQSLPAPGPGLSSMPPEARGDLLMVHREYVRAIEAYKEAPVSARVCNKIGSAYHHLFALTVAHSWYEKALQLQPDYANAISNLGTYAYDQQEYGKAVRYYRQALQLSPDSPIILANLGTTYFAQGKAREGTAAYQAAFAMNPHIFDEHAPQLISSGTTRQTRARLSYCVAQLYAGAKRSEEAIEYLRKAVDLGFSDRKRLRRDQAFADLRVTPEFGRIVNSMDGR